MSLQQIYIGGSSAGLKTDVKPFLLNEQAFSVLYNAYVWRERVKKKEGSEFLGRLRRELVAVVAAGTITLVNPSPNTFNIFTLLGLLATEANAQIQPGTVTNPITIVIGAQTLTDTTGTGTMAVTAGNITAAVINYAQGTIQLTFAAPAGPLAVTVSMFYYPGLPAMGIWQREISNTNNEQTIFWDTKYSYINSSGADNAFQDFDATTTWSGTDADFFWTTNYRGITPDVRLMFATNFVNDANNPIRYTSGGAWQTFTPVVSQSGGVATRTYMTQAKILIPYYGRLVALNVWESPDNGAGVPNYAAGTNIYNRCLFSQIGNPLETTVALPIVDTAWRYDQFGRGGFIDAPTNEAIQSAIFFKNTLIVGFERSTWQLRYAGEYGLPFIWERISSDFGCESTNSAILFDKGVAQVADRAIVSATSTNVERIDLQIPDTVFSFRNDENGISRVQGVRNFQKELVYWCYVDTDLENSQITWKYPNKSLLYNYRNQTYAQFRNNVTCFGTYQSPIGITWDRTDIYWDDDDVFWNNDLANEEFPAIVSGNQQGYIHYYCNSSIEEPSLSISAMDFSVTPVRLTVPNHNLGTIDWVRVTGAIFNPADAVASAINGMIFIIKIFDANTIDLYTWNGTNDVAYSNASVSTYVGSGELTLLSQIDIQTKDFNPYADKGTQMKLSYIDFLTDATANAVISVNLLVNATPAVSSNVLVGNTQVETSLPAQFYVPSSNYAWHRFFATSTGQYIRIQITYDNDLMSVWETHNQDFTLNAMALYVRPGSRNVL